MQFLSYNVSCISSALNWRYSLCSQQQRHSKHSIPFPSTWFNVQSADRFDPFCILVQTSDKNAKCYTGLTAKTSCHWTPFVAMSFPAMHAKKERCSSYNASSALLLQMPHLRQITGINCWEGAPNAATDSKMVKTQLDRAFLCMFCC